MSLKTITIKCLDLIELRKARKAAKKYNLDFVKKCYFSYQLYRNFSGLKNGTGEIVKVPMESGKIGLYKVNSDRSNYGNTGQYDWYFKFQGYESNE